MNRLYSSRMRQVQLQTVARYGLHMCWPPDQRNPVSGTCQHGAKKTAYGACANDGNVLKKRGAHVP